MRKKAVVHAISKPFHMDLLGYCNGTSALYKSTSLFFYSLRPFVDFFWFIPQGVNGPPGDQGPEGQTGPKVGTLILSQWHSRGLGNQPITFMGATVWHFRTWKHIFTQHLYCQSVLLGQRSHESWVDLSVHVYLNTDPSLSLTHWPDLSNKEGLGIKSDLEPLSYLAIKNIKNLT